MILLRIFMMTFGKSLKIFEILPEILPGIFHFHFLAKILEDLSFSCQDFQGSFIFLPRSSGIFHFFAKISHFPVKILKDLGKEMEDH